MYGHLLPGIGSWKRPWSQQTAKYSYKSLFSSCLGVKVLKPVRAMSYWQCFKWVIEKTIIWWFLRQNIRGYSLQILFFCQRAFSFYQSFSFPRTRWLAILLFSQKPKWKNARDWEPTKDYVLLNCADFVVAFVATLCCGGMREREREKKECHTGLCKHKMETGNSFCWESRDGKESILIFYNTAYCPFHKLVQIITSSSSFFFFCFRRYYF